MTAELSDWVKNRIFSAFNAHILAGWNLQSLTPEAKIQHDGRVVFMFKAQHGSSCRFQRGPHGSPGNVNYLVLRSTGSISLRCFAPKCHKKEKVVYRKQGIYQRLLCEYTSAHQ